MRAGIRPAARLRRRPVHPARARRRRRLPRLLDVQLRARRAQPRLHRQAKARRRLLAVAVRRQARRRASGDLRPARQSDLRSRARQKPAAPRRRLRHRRHGVDPRSRGGGAVLLAASRLAVLRRPDDACRVLSGRAVPVFRGGDHGRALRRGSADEDAVAAPALRERDGARGGEARDGRQVPGGARLCRRAAAGGGRGDPRAAARGEAQHGQHPLRQVQLMGKRLVCKVADIPENGLKECEAEGGLKLVVANAGGEYYGFQAVCPHQDVPLCEGLFDGSTLTCHMHLWQWDIRTGEPRGIAEAPLQRYPLSREGDALYLGAEGTALDVGELFNGLAPSILEKLAQLARRETHDAGAMLYRPGDPAEDFYVLDAGRVEFLAGRGAPTAPWGFMLS